jgi:hypothetical protein
MHERILGKPRVRSTDETAAPALPRDQRIAGNVSQQDENSHKTAFETLMSEPLWNRIRPDETAAQPVSELTRRENQEIMENVSRYDQNSHNVAFETWMSAPIGIRGRADDTIPYRRRLEAVAGSRLAWMPLPV